MVGGAGTRALAALLLMLSGAAGCASPQIGSTPPPRPSDTAAGSPRQYVVVAADGELSIAGAPTTLERLPADLDAAFKRMGVQGGRADQTVMIVSGPTITYGTFMGLMNVLSAAGWTRIAAATVDR
jgi:biopolymer transport protein ExbD